MKKGKLIAKIFGIVLVFVMVGSMLGGLPALVSKVEASPGTIYVPDDYLTIQEAVDAASPGDTIIVRDGTYIENVDVNKDHLTIQSENGAEATIVQAANEYDNVFAVTADYVTIKGMGVYGAKGMGHVGISLHSASSCAIEDNRCGWDSGHKNRIGIVLFSSSGNTLLGNTCNENLENGISLYSSSYNTITGNTCNENLDGIRLSSSSSNIFSGNTCDKNRYYGIYLSYSSSNIFSGNTCNESPWGINLYCSSSNTFTDNTMVDDGILIEGALEHWNTHDIDTSNTVNGKPVYYWKDIDGGTVPSGAGQVILANCTNVVVENQDVSNGAIGVQLGFSSGNKIVNNTANENTRDGISLYSSSYNTITGNTCDENLSYGICLWDSSSNALTGNTMVDDGIIIRGDSIVDWNTHTISASNTVNGKPVYYWKDINSGTVPTGAGQVILAHCRNVVVENQDVSNGTVGIQLGFSSSNKIANNTANENTRDGISLYSSSYNTITGNTCNENNENGGAGILLVSSTFSTLMDNICNENYYGVSLVYSRYNTIYLNNFINNRENFASWSSTNTWLNSTEQITYTYNGNTYTNFLGNYWDDYSGSDGNRDGIGYTPYTINSDSDNYPLMEPFENYEIGETPPADQPPTASASEISGQPETMHPYNTYSVTARYHDPDGRDNLKYCYLRLNHPSKPLTIMWDQSNGNYGPWAGEKGEDYILVTSVISTELADGYELSWSFELKSSWPGTDSPIDFGVYAWDDGDLKSGWDYDDTNAAFIVQPFLPVLISPLSITPEKETYEIGETLTAQFAIRNQGAMPFTLDVLTAGGRCNGWCMPSGCPDFPHYSVTLQPDEIYQYEGDFTLPKSGNYLFFVAYHIDSPTPDEAKLLDENNWNTNINPGTGLTPQDRIRTVIVPQTEEEADLSAEINRLLAINVQYPPYLLTPEGFQMSVAIVWMNWTAWITQVELNEKYDELYFTGIDYDCASRTALINAKAALNRGDIEIAQEYVQDYFLYNKLSLMSFNAATDYFSNMAGAAETLAEGVRDGSQAAVKFGLTFISPTAAKAADYFFIGSDFVVDYYFRGEDEALKDALVEAAITTLFNEIPLAPGGRTLENYIANRVGKVTFPLLQTWIKSGQWQFFLSRGLKYGAEWLSEEVAEEVASLILDELGKSVDLIESQLKSPVELLVYDSQGNAAGLLNGQVEHAIPRSMYANETVTIFFPSGPCTYSIIGKDEGVYGLEVFHDEGDDTANFNVVDIPTSAGVVHQYTIDWDALSEGEEGVTVQIDSDGDGEFEDTFTSDNELTQDEFMLRTATTIDFDPDTLNLKTKGKYVTAYIELPTGYDVSQIDVSSITLNGTIPALDKPTKVGDYDSDSVPDLMVKFDASAVKDLLTLGSQVEITVTGEVAGIGFEGSDTIRVISK